MDTLERAGGSVPWRLLDERLRSERDGRSPNQLGMVPWRLLDERSMDSRFWRVVVLFIRCDPWEH